MPLTTEEVLQNHLQAAGKGVDAIMEDFTEESVMITHDATYHGLEEIRGFFSALLDPLPEEFLDAFTVTRRVVIDEVAYIIWEARPWVESATDTFVVRDGKIRYQTFTAFSASG